MTTIVYRNRVLATDSRATNKDDERRRCHSCGENVTTRDDSTKITLELGDIKYNDEPISAIAQCGVRGASIKAINLIKEGKDIKQYLTVTKDVGGLLAHTFALIIITTKSVWVLSATSQTELGYREKRYELTDYVAEGSGKAAHQLSKSNFGLIYIGAVKELRKKAAWFSKEGPRAPLLWRVLHLPLLCEIGYGPNQKDLTEIKESDL